MGIASVQERKRLISVNLLFIDNKYGAVEISQQSGHLICRWLTWVGLPHSIQSYKTTRNDTYEHRKEVLRAGHSPECNKTKSETNKHKSTKQIKSKISPVDQLTASFVFQKFKIEGNGQNFLYNSIFKNCLITSYARLNLLIIYQYT